MSAWHPRAIRIVYPSIGSYIEAENKLLWHTTEGFGLPHYVGSNPHFTFNPKTGQLWQHQPITEPAKALLHPAGTPETNRARVIQVELIGFAAQTHTWTDEVYARIAALARWIEKNAGVPRKSDVAFTSTSTHQATRLTGQEFIKYQGHLGHEHAANNLHWDPGRFLVDKVINLRSKPKPPSRPHYPGVPIRLGSKGQAVRRVQGWLKAAGWSTIHVDGKFGAQTVRIVRIYQKHHGLHPDGVVGPETWNLLSKEKK